MNLVRCTAAATASVGLALGSTAHADNCSGYDVLVNQHSDTLELAKDHSLTTSIDHAVVTTDDAKSIWNTTTGRCSGVFLATPDGKVAGMGFCLRKDKDGNTASVSWDLPAGAEKGSWKTAGGTGKFAGKTDSGWWQPVVNEGKFSIARWGGTCK